MSKEELIELYLNASDEVKEEIKELLDSDQSLGIPSKASS